MNERLNRRDVLRAGLKAGIAGVGAAALGTQVDAAERTTSDPVEEMHREIKVLETLRDQYIEAKAKKNGEEEARLGLEIGKQVEKMNAISERLTEKMPQKGR